MDIKAYFDRIGLSSSPREGLEFLQKLQYAHVMAIPYENIDILNKKPLNLQPEALFEKIVTHKRGGYCFEVNLLLSAVLKQLGFRVVDFGARFLRNQEVLSFRRHRVVGVKLGKDTYILDVGIGQQAQKHPLKLEEGLIQRQFDEAYKFEKSESGEWVLYDLHEGFWREFYSFYDDAWLDVDFEPASFYCEKHPDSVFNKDYMIAIKTANGRKALNGRDFKIFEKEELIYIEENISDSRLNEILEKEFNIVI